MDEVEFTNAHVHTDASCNVAQEEPVHGELWEEEFNPLGMLDLVYVEEDKEETNNVERQGTAEEIDLSDGDEDEEGELEPVAVVDVSPIREEDFLPEAMNEDVLESNKSTWTTSSASNADSELHQWRGQDNPLLDTEHTNQLAEQQSQIIWNTQRNRFINQHLPDAVPKDFSYQWNYQLNQRSSTGLPQLSQKFPREVQLTRSRRYRQQYRVKNAELDRIRNREYARRYRQTHADLVRQRQREYIKKYRERKRLLEEEAFNKKVREQDDVIILSSKCMEREAVTLNNDTKNNKSGLDNSERNISSCVSKNGSEKLMTVHEQDEEIVI